MGLKIKTNQGSTICPLIDCHALVDNFEKLKSHME